MKVRDLVTARGLGGYYHWDLAALRAGAEQDGLHVSAPPLTPGFERVVEPAEVLSVLLVLEDGQVGFGDCVDVILAGAAGRDSPFRASAWTAAVEAALRDRLIGADIDAFRPLAEAIDTFEVDGARLHTALRYGLSQALLHAASLAAGLTMAEVIAREYATRMASAPIPMLSMCLTHEREMVDKMILKRAELLPHADYMNAQRDLGAHGEKLIDYVRWLAARIDQIGAPDYRPTLHLDVYGTMGELFDMDVEAIAAYLGRVRQVTGGRPLLIETPIVALTREAQIDAFSRLRSAIREQGHDVRIIADEWCNTVEDIRAFADAQAADFLQVKTPDLGGLNNTIEACLYMRRRGVGVYVGGSGNETDQSTRITTHVALACSADMLLAKPGQGVDEALMINRNEMARTLALIAHRS